MNDQGQVQQETGPGFDSDAFREYLQEYISTLHCNSDLNGFPLLTYLLHGVGIPIVSLIGIIGNILSIIVLTRPAMRSSTSIILIGLSICDLVFVLTNIFLHAIYGTVLYFCWWSRHYTHINPVIFPIFFPISVTAQTGSIYFTLAVTLERFVVVYRPLLARSYCSVKNASMATGIIAIFSILYSLPTWWQFTYIEDYIQGVYARNQLTVTALGNNEDYQLYYSFWGNIVVVILIPFFTLAILNSAIFWKVRNSNKMRRNMTRTESNEVSITKMLLTIATIFLICYTPGLIQRSTQIIGGIEAIRPIAVVVTIGIFLINLNSSINFIIYCLLGEKFRKTFLELFHLKSCKGRANGNTAGRARPGTKVTAVTSLTTEARKSTGGATH